MRRTLPLLTLLLLPTPASAAPFIGLGLGGPAGSANAFHFTSTFGFAGRNPRAIDGLFAGEASLIFNGDDRAPDDRLDYGIPHSDFTTIGTFQIAPELALGLKGGIEVAPHAGLLLTFSGGTAIRQYTEVIQSDVTGWYYENGTTERSQLYYGVGLVYLPADSRWGFHAQFDRRRGLELGYQIDF